MSRSSVPASVGKPDVPEDCEVHGHEVLRCPLLGLPSPGTRRKTTREGPIAHYDDSVHPVCPSMTNPSFDYTLPIMSSRTPRSVHLFDGHKEYVYVSHGYKDGLLQLSTR